MQFCNNAWRSLEGDEGLYQLWSTLVEGGKERYLPPGKLTLELVHSNKKNKLLCLWTMQLTKWAG